MKNLLITTKTCPNCPAVKDFLELSEIDYTLVDASTPDGLEVAKKFGIGSVPALVVVDEKGNMIDSAYGLGDIEALVSK
jgi:ribonucleoside-triphosphate reductase (formate)